MPVRRRKYFINPKVQLTYICICVIPALVTVLIFTHLLVRFTEIKLYSQKESFLMGISSVNLVLIQLERTGDPDTIAKRLQEARKELMNLRFVMEQKQIQAVRQLNNNRDLLILALLGMFIMIGLLSLIKSHRIAGPLCRMKKSIDMLVEGKQVPTISLRKGDEFTDLAASLERLRKKLEK